MNFVVLVVADSSRFVNFEVRKQLQRRVARVFTSDHVHFPFRMHQRAQGDVLARCWRKRDSAVTYRGGLGCREWRWLLGRSR